MRHAIVLSTHAARFEAVAFKGDLEANVAKVAAWGYEGVELAIRDPGLVDAEELARIVSRFEVSVPAIGTGQAWGEEGLSYTDPDPAIRRAAIERTRSHVPVAERLNALIIIGLLRGLVRPEVSQEQAMTWLVVALRECCQAAHGAGVRLAVEPLNRYETTLVNTVQQGLALIDAVGAGNLGLLLDTFHMNIEEPDMAASIRLCGERLFHFHVADSNRLYPGAGHIDFGSLLGTLSDAGYRGWVSGEFMPIPDADTAARRSLAYLQGL